MECRAGCCENGKKAEVWFQICGETWRRERAGKMFVASMFQGLARCEGSNS